MGANQQWSVCNRVLAAVMVGSSDCGRGAKPTYNTRKGSHDTTIRQVAGL